ncbi:MAG: cyclase family protein [Acidimicrobiia bacterium]|nr:cyclase family protein [Acidimicrobiia bacterium]
MSTIIDLSQDIYETMMVYPGHLKTVQFQHAYHYETEVNFESDFSFQTTGLMLNDNGPTHVDSFSHLDPDPDAPSIDQMPLDLFYGSGICLDVSHVAPRTDITEVDCEEALTASGQELNEGDVLLFHTGTWEKYAGTRDYLTTFPGLGEAASAWIADHKVKVFGVDSPTPDNPASKIYPCHLMSRHKRITHYENLANLRLLLGKRFDFYGFPLKIVGGHGGPTRAVAILSEE